MISETKKLYVVKQAGFLNVCGGSIYYSYLATSPADLAIMRRIDELHLEYPFAYSRMLQRFLNRKIFAAGRLHILMLMKKMGIEAISRRPNTSKPESGRKIHLYLLRNLAVTKPDQAWGFDITSIPMAKGFVFQAVVFNWFTRRVLSWRLPISMDSPFSIEAVENALARLGKPEIFNSDQGSQFESNLFTYILEQRDIQISMDSKGAWRDNVFVQRLRRTIKYDEVYLKADACVSTVRKCLSHYMAFLQRLPPEFIT